MHVLGVVGPGASEAVSRFVPRLDGRVATVESLPDAGTNSPETPDSAAAYGLGGDGSWVGAGEGRSLDDLLDEFAPRFDYALLSGFSGARVPTVVLGDGPAPEGEVLARADTPGDVALDDVIEAVHDAEPHVTLEMLVRRAKASPRADRAGAIATFTGRVRAHDSPDDARTTALEFEAYEGVADERMAALEQDLEGREGVFDVLMHHRTGRIEDGEDIVFVVVLAGHRAEAFRTVEDGIDRLKQEVPIFKKETTTEEDFWVHDRE
jgi:molybdopterin synthase catalytic subunit